MPSSKCASTNCFKHAIELGAIGDFGERIVRRFLVQRLHTLFQRDLAGRVMQQDRRAMSDARAADDRHQMHIDRERFS